MSRYLLPAFGTKLFSILTKYGGMNLLKNVKYIQYLSIFHGREEALTRGERRYETKSVFRSPYITLLMKNDHNGFENKRFYETISLPVAHLQHWT